MTNSVMTDRVVLGYHDGEPTLWLSVIDGRPSLHWMLIGYVEPFTVWVDVALEWDEADRIMADPTMLLDELLQTMPGRPLLIRFDTRQEQDWTIRVSAVVPDVRVTGTWAIETLRDKMAHSVVDAGRVGDSETVERNQQALSILEPA